jgi:bifunctional UDP-N-acetylglucosamine pyrophosphorylase / glucosamine-1-phosphate N-acetyltransferase
MVAVAILAAGKGTRMKSELPKVLHKLGAKTLIERVLECCQSVQPMRQLAIVGYRAEQVQQELSINSQIEFVEQKEQLGTGHAIQQLIPHLKEFKGDLLVLNGDVPLLRDKTIQNLLEIHKKNDNDATILTAQLPNPKGYGRVFCDGNNYVTQIVEDRDCSTTQRQNNRVNGGIYCFNWQKLAQILPKLSADNDQQEYYLTDVVHFLEKIMAVDVEDYLEISGINDRSQLAEAYNILQMRVKDHWMKEGVTMIDPHSITIEDTVKIESDVIIQPQTHLRGNTTIAKGSNIGPGCLINNSKIAQNVTVIHSVISDSEIKENSQIGPFAHIRGEAKIGQSCRIGNFVEVKKTTIGDKTNAAHLAYLGDATLGNNVNIGAGTITANYDGVKKHPTHIGKGTKTGANSVLVAPITLGDNVTVAAGSTITKDVENDALVVARTHQKVIKDWANQK